MDQASQVREKIDIVSLISEYIPLKKAGRNFTSVCPFHKENSPSFVVSPERQIWHCFGCGKGGDAFSFLMEYENLEFIEALRILAKKAGVTLKNLGSDYSSSKKDNIYSLNKLAGEYYTYVLTKHPVGAKALDYLINERRLTKDLIKTFGIGYAPSSGEDLSNYLMKKKGFKSFDLVEAGLSIQKGPRTVDFFRNRIMFPLSDSRGNIVGFSGRILEKDSDGPKYINTRETLVYHKGSQFFGLNIAKEEIKKKEFSIVVEGEFDVITSFKEGIGNTVALKGTAFTENQAMLLSRFAPKVALCLDQDSAGIEAMKRSIPILEKRGLTITVIVTDGKDPDEAIKSNPVNFKKAIKNDVEVYDYLISKLKEENDPKTASGKKKITDEIFPLISSIQNEVIKEHYLKKLSQEIDTSVDSLVKQIDKKTDEKKEAQILRVEKRDRREILEEYLLALISQAASPGQMLIKSKDILTEYDFKIPSIGKIFSEMLVLQNKKLLEIKNLSKYLAAELLPVFDKSFLMPLPKYENEKIYEEEIIRISKELRVMYLKEKIKLISSSLKNPEISENEIKSIREEIANITALTS